MPIFNRDKNPGLTMVINALELEMKDLNGDSAEYATMRAHLTELYSLKKQDASTRVSPDTLAVVAGNLAIALLIVSYEQKNVVTSKVLGFLSKVR